MKMFLIAVISMFLIGCCEQADDLASKLNHSNSVLKSSYNDLAIESFEYGYLAAKAGISYEEAYRKIAGIIYRKDKPK